MPNGKICGKIAFPLGIRKVLNLGRKAEKQVQNENYTEDWALGSHPRVSDSLDLSLSINIVKFSYTPCRWSFKLVVHCLWCQGQRRFLPFAHYSFPGL